MGPKGVVVVYVRLLNTSVGSTVSKNRILFPRRKLCRSKSIFMLESGSDTA